MEYYSVEHPSCSQSTPWRYRVWCALDSEEPDRLHIFVFSGKVCYEEACGMAKDDYGLFRIELHPVHGNWVWFYDTVKYLFENVDVHIPLANKADNNRLLRYLCSVLSKPTSVQVVGFDCSQCGRSLYGCKYADKS